MVSAKSRHCLVGFELSHDSVRIAAIDSAMLRSESAASRHVCFDEIALPSAHVAVPGRLPPDSVLGPLLKASLGRMGVAGGDAAVALGSLHAVLRCFVGTEESVRTALQEAAKRTVSYVQLGLGDRVVGEHVHRLPDGRSHGLLGVSAAGTLDPLTALLAQFGLRTRLIEPALISLARVASFAGQLGEEPAVLVSVEAGSVGIGVIHGGHVLFSHRLAGAPSEHSDGRAPDRPSDLPRMLARISRYSARIFNWTEDLRQVVLCGPEEDTRTQAQSLKDSGRFDVIPLRLGEAFGQTVAGRSGDLAAKQTQAVALGAAAGLVESENAVRGPNLVSEPKVQRRSLIETSVRSMIWPTLAAFVLWGVVCLAQGRLDKSLDRMRIEAEHPSPVETTHKELQMKLVQYEQRAEHLGELIGHVPDHHYEQIIDMVRICVPNRLWLTRVRMGADGHLSIMGAAYDEALIYQFRQYLDGAPHFEGVTISSTSDGRQGAVLVMEFTIECQVAASWLASAVPST